MRPSGRRGGRSGRTAPERAAARMAGARARVSNESSRARAMKAPSISQVNMPGYKRVDLTVKENKQFIQKNNQWIIGQEVKNAVNEFSLTKSKISLERALEALKKLYQECLFTKMSQNYNDKQNDDPSECESITQFMDEISSHEGVVTYGKADRLIKMSFEKRSFFTQRKRDEYI